MKNGNCSNEVKSRLAFRSLRCYRRIHLPRACSLQMMLRVDIILTWSRSLETLLLDERWLCLMILSRLLIRWLKIWIVITLINRSELSNCRMQSMCSNRKSSRCTIALEKHPWKLQRHPNLQQMRPWLNT